MKFVCPVCRGELEGEFSCPREGLAFPQVEGIWRFLPPGRAAHYAQFIREYETVRRAEGRGSTEAGYYRALPFHADPGWRIRAAGYEAFVRAVLRPREGGAPLPILDLGAGSGWLANRLAARGHTAAAVDLLVNDWDGLAAGRHFETAFVRVQAEFDGLPFEAGTFDLIVFNASFHYSTDYARTLAAVLPLLAAGGALVVLDTPVYRDAASGRRMAAEREAEFMEKYGFASNSLPLGNFLTREGAAALAGAFGVRVHIIQPRRGVRWRLRPLLARLRGRREPADFPVLVFLQ
jgi:SAM-dependent methyltransferase